MRLILILLIASQCFGQSGWKTLIGKSLSWSDTTSTLATQYDLTLISGGGGQAYSDTNTWDATKTNIALLQSDSDTSSWDATRSFVTGYIDSSKVVFWPDTALTNGPVTNYDLLQLFSPYTRNYGYVYKNTGATTASTVGLVAPTLTATVASNDQTSGAFVQHTSAATANSPTGLISSAFTQFRRDYEPDFYAVVRTGAKIDSLVFAVGFTSAAFDTARAPNRYEIKFSFHTGVAGEANWQTITNNNSGAGQSKKDTGVAVAINTTYKMRIVCNTANADVKFYIDGNLVTTHTVSLPTSTQGLGYGIRVTPRFTTGTSARIVNWSKVVIVWNG